jgi:hypothetical protein
MKKIFIVFIIGLMSFGIAGEVNYKATFTEKEVQEIYLHLARVSVYMDNSNLPHGEVKFVRGQIDSAWNILQSRMKIDSTGKK